MMNNFRSIIQPLLALAFFFLIFGLADAQDVTSRQQKTTLPQPYATRSTVNNANITGWTEWKTPVAPPGFKVSRFADGFKSPRWIYAAMNGDVFVSEASTKPTSANQITILRDSDKDGQYDVREVFLSNQNKPFGMLILDNFFYVANTDGVVRYPYKSGQTSITETGTKILDLPAGGYNNHWTRNIIASPDGKKIMISVGSGSNNGENGMENEIRRADILEINPDGTGEKIYAAGLRNPVGMQYYPGSTTLWTTVNERDGLGDELVPDYLTSVKRDGFYGWPYAYFGTNEDPRMKGQWTDLVRKTLVPDVDLGSHTASLGLTFYSSDHFPAKYRLGAFVGQHGSWNSSTLVGYKVVFIPFKNGKPSGKPEDFLTGFIDDPSKSKVHGRPVGVTTLHDGSLLVADDASDVIWQVRVDD